MPDDEQVNKIELHILLKEFWLMLIHAILYCSGIYDKRIFQRVRLLDNVVGYKCNHPDVCAWVEATANSVSNGLQAMKLSRIAFVVLNVTESGLRKFVSPGRLVVDTEFLPKSADVPSESSRSKLLTQLKGALSSIYAQLPIVFPVPYDPTGPELTMVVLAERGEGENLTLDSNEWMPFSTQFQSISGPPDPDKIVPIRFVHGEEFTFSLYYQS